MACGTSPNIGFYMNAGRSSDDYTDNVISENDLFCRHTMICASTYTVNLLCDIVILMFEEIRI